MITLGRVITLASITVSAMDSHILHTLRKPIIVAHRGFSSKFPENTLVAFTQAIGCADMIEFDVALSKDSHAVIMHDATIDRTTDGNGHVTNFTLAQLQQFDAGGWFAPSFAGETIPTLEQVVSTVGNKIALNVEIKHEVFRSHDLAVIADTCVPLVKQYGLLDQTIFSSFDRDGITKVKERHPEITIMLLFDVHQHDQAHLLSSGLIDYIKQHRADGINIDKALVTDELIRRLHAHGLKIGVYTVNDPKLAQKLGSMGVDLLYTDVPGRVAS